METKDITQFKKEAIETLSHYREIYQKFVGVTLKPELVEEKKQMDDKIALLNMTLAMHDPWFFIMAYGFSQDEHDQSNPFKPLIGCQETPEDYKYMKETTEIWQEENLIVVHKSRQLRVTWLFIHLLTWDSIARKGRRNGMQSKKEEDGDALVGRSEVLLRHLPIEMTGFKPNCRTYCRIILPAAQSVLWGLPQGAEIARSHTFSNYFIDEACYQDDLEGVYDAVRPTIDGGGKVIMVSSPPKIPRASSKFFYNLAYDDYGAVEGTSHGRLTQYDTNIHRNKNGFVRIFVNYEDLPHRWIVAKENGREIRRWVTKDEARPIISKGMNPTAWAREHLGSFEAGSDSQMFEPDVIKMILETQVQKPIKQGRLMYDREIRTPKFIEDGAGSLLIYKMPTQEIADDLGRVKSIAGEYVIGVDIGSGLANGDPSAAVIVDTRTKRIVAILNIHKRPRPLAHDLYLLALYYNEAFIVPEANGYGLSTIECLREGNPERFQEPYWNIYKSKIEDDYRDKEKHKLGWYTSWKTKIILIDEFADAVREKRMFITSAEVVQEMRNYVVFESELDTPQKMGPCRGHDDLVIAAALAWQGCKERPYFEPEKPAYQDSPWYEPALMNSSGYSGY